MTQSPTDETVEAVALLPCPFCGGEPQAYEGKFCSSVKCDNGHAIHEYKPTLHKAIAAWNTRASIPASPPSPAGDVKRVAEYRDIFAEITAKAVPLCEDETDPDRITGYRLSTGPIDRAAGRLGFQMFDGERIMTSLVAEVEELKRLAALQPSPSPAGDVEQLRQMALTVDHWSHCHAELFTEPTEALSKIGALVRTTLEATEPGNLAALQPPPSPASNGAMPAAGMGRMISPPPSPRQMASIGVSRAATRLRRESATAEHASLLIMRTTILIWPGTIIGNTHGSR